MECGTWNKASVAYLYWDWPAGSFSVWFSKDDYVRRRHRYSFYRVESWGLDSLLLLGRLLESLHTDCSWGCECRGGFVGYERCRGGGLVAGLLLRLRPAANFLAASLRRFEAFWKCAQTHAGVLFSFWFLQTDIHLRFLPWIYCAGKIRSLLEDVDFLPHVLTCLARPWGALKYLRHTWHWKSVTSVCTNESIQIEWATRFI